MTTADVLEPRPEQTIMGQAELIVREWRFRTAPAQDAFKGDNEKARRGRENARKTNTLRHAERRRFSGK